MDLTVQVEGRSFHVRIGKDGTEVDGKPVDVELAPRGLGPVRSTRVDGRSLRVVPERNGTGAWSLEVGGVRRRVEVMDPGEAAMRRIRAASTDSGGPPPVRAPMPGLVVRVEVQVGDLVEAGGGIMIVEAMKMENELRAVGAGRVRAVHAREGEAVEKDQILVEFEKSEGGE
ncbi:MAG: biotin/lipoyl-containing protein [Gemmatimonadota bacterium]